MLINFVLPLSVDFVLMWRRKSHCLLEVALKTQKQENQKTEETSQAWARGARSRLEMPVASVSWRGAPTGWRQAQPVLIWRFSRKICFGKYLFWILFYFIR
jgi:hypothetical protein